MATRTLWPSNAGPVELHPLPPPLDAVARTTLLLPLVQVLVIAASLYVYLEGWRRDLRVPLGFSIDYLIALMQSKSTIDNGWWWFNPMLGAPFGLDERAFPTNSNVDQAIVWIVSLFAHHPLRAINLAWMVMVVLSGPTASWCLRNAGVSTVSSFVAGTLFALSPYAMYRNIGHFWMVIYLVPFASSAALLIASGRLPERILSRPFLGLLAGCALIGFDYVYYAFFGCFLIGIAALTGFVASRQRRVLVAGVLCIAVIAGATLLNLAPSLYSWRTHGRPIIIHDKVPAESEVYGLKIRQLVSPLFESSFPPFRAWTQRESSAQFPVETENMVSRLGLIGTVGFLVLLGLLFVPSLANGSDAGGLLRGASQLTLAAVLLGTVGGFGSLFNLLITPEIRAYNRIAAFIAFFALTAVAIAMDLAFKTSARRGAAALFILALGLSDQRVAARQLNAGYAAIAAEIAPLEAFVHELEARLPDGAMVLQLPFRTYMNDAGVARMQPYDHLKFYLVSSKIRWSYPALSNDQVRWQLAAASLDPRRLPGQLKAEGFAAILVDRFGYADNGAAVTSAIREQLEPSDVIADTGRYLVLDIRSVIPAAGGSALTTASRPATLGMEACLEQRPPVFALDRIGGTTAPLGEDPLHVSSWGEVRVSGWALDSMTDATAGGLDVVWDQKPFPTIYGTDRGDVTTYFKRPDYLQSGFAAAIPARTIGSGQHTFALRVVASDRRCYYETPGRTVIID